MNRAQRLLLIGATSATAATTACWPSKDEFNKLKTKVDGLDQQVQKQDENMKMYFDKNGDLKVSLYKYLDRLSDAVCQLEARNTAGLNPNKRICDDKVPPDKIPIPPYPPKP